MEASRSTRRRETTGWSARMLRYVERTGLVTPARSASGYRLYGPAELQRLRTLKELLAAVRHRAVRRGVRGAAGQRSRSARRGRRAGWRRSHGGPDDVDAEDWLRFEQDKHQKLLAAA